MQPKRQAWLPCDGTRAEALDPTELQRLQHAPIVEEPSEAATRLLDALRARLGPRADLVMGSVAVATRDDGTVTLHGVVPTFGDWDALVETARCTGGSVDDQLRIGRCR